MPKPKSSAIDTARATDLVTRMMAIPGRSGDERAVADFVVAELRAAGVPQSAIRFDTVPKRSPIGGSCGNLIVKLPASPGLANEPRRMLMAHLDTVPVCVGAKPVKRGRRIVSADRKTGLGADDRSGVAVILLAAIEIVRGNLPHPPLTFLFCVQEEVGLFGARFADVKLLGNPAMAFNYDGGAPRDVTIGATGAWRLSIRVTGIPAHAGVHPEQGVSAIAIAALAIADLQKRGWHGLIMKRGVRGTSNVGVIQGGEATNVVTHDLLIKAEARAHDKKLRREIVDQYIAAFTRAAKSVRSDAGKSGSVEFEVRHDYEAFRLDEKSPAVLAACDAVRQLGLTPNLRVGNGGLDANWMNQHGIPTVTLNTGQHNIHTTDEYLDIAEFHSGCELALKLATQK